MPALSDDAFKQLRANMWHGAFSAAQKCAMYRSWNSQRTIDRARRTFRSKHPRPLILRQPKKTKPLPELDVEVQQPARRRHRVDHAETIDAGARDVVKPHRLASLVDDHRECSDSVRSRRLLTLRAAYAVQPPVFYKPPVHDYRVCEYRVPPLWMPGISLCVDAISSDSCNISSPSSFASSSSSSSSSYKTVSSSSTLRSGSSGDSLYVDPCLAPRHPPGLEVPPREGVSRSKLKSSRPRAASPRRPLVIVIPARPTKRQINEDVDANLCAEPTRPRKTHKRRRREHCESELRRDEAEEQRVYAQSMVLAYESAHSERETAQREHKSDYPDRKPTRPRRSTAQRPHGGWKA